MKIRQLFLVLVAGLLLDLVAIADEGIPPAISVAIVRSVPEGIPEEADNSDARDLMQQLHDILKDESLDPTIVGSEIPDEVFQSNPSVELVVSSAFELRPSIQFSLTLHWRPNHSKKFKATVDSKLPLFDAAYQMIDHVKRSGISRQIIATRSDRMRDASESQSYDGLVVKAFSLRYEGDLDGAVESLNKAIEFDRDRAKTDTNLLFLLGLCQKDLQNFSAAITAFEQVADEGLGHDGALLELGNIQFALGNYSVAADHYRIAMEANKTNAIRGRWNLGLSLFQNGEFEDAIKTIEPLEKYTSYRDNVPELKKRIREKQAEKKSLKDQMEQGKKAREEHRKNRAALFAKMWRILGGVFVLLVIAIVITMIVRTYRAAQRDPELTSAQRLEFAGTLMAGLFSVLSLVGGTMLGLLIAK